MAADQLAAPHLDPGSVRNHGVLRDYNHTIPDVVICAIDIGRFSVGRNHDAFTDPGVLIDYRPINHGIPSDSYRREQARVIFRDFRLPHPRKSLRP